MYHAVDQTGSLLASAENGDGMQAVPSVSIGLPVYNGERYLHGAIDSILSQTYEDLELIISDNGSTDGTEEIARDAADRDRRVRYLRSEQNRGAMWNFNEVFRHARGPYFKPACHDDLHAPAFIERCVEALRDAPPEVTLVYPPTMLIDENDLHLGPYDDGLDLRERDPAARLARLLDNLRMVNPLFGLHRASAFGSTRGFQDFVSADVTLLAELALRGQFWQLDSEPLFLRRDHEGRSMRKHVDLEELATWYDPNRNVVLQGRYLRQFLGLLQAALEAPLPPTDRVRAFGVVLTRWGLRWKGTMARELVSSARRARKVA